MSQADSNRLILPSTFEAARDAQAAVVHAAKKHGFDEENLFAIRLALDEALCNAVRHGNCNDPSKQIIVEYHVTDQRLKVSVIDQGCGFSPADLPDPTRDENLERPNGRGVMLIKAYMTQVFYNERGNCVTMIKERSCKEHETT